MFTRIFDQVVGAVLTSLILLALSWVGGIPDMKRDIAELRAIAGKIQSYDSAMNTRIGSLETTMKASDALLLLKIEQHAAAQEGKKK